jgi:hypothetical protein
VTRRTSRRRPVLIPESGWLDVPPLSGVIYTEGKTESLEVTVDVVAVPCA